MLNMAPQAPDGESLGSLQPNIEPVFKLDREDTKDEEPNLLLLRIIDCKQLRWVTLAFFHSFILPWLICMPQSCRLGYVWWVGRAAGGYRASLFLSGSGVLEGFLTKFPAI